MENQTKYFFFHFSYFLHTPKSFPMHHKKNSEFLEFFYFSILILRKKYNSSYNYCIKGNSLCLELNRYTMSMLYELQSPMIKGTELMNI